MAAFLKPLVPHAVTVLLMAQAGKQLDRLAGLTGKLSVCLTSVGGSRDGEAQERRTGAGHSGKADTLIWSFVGSLPHAASTPRPQAHAAMAAGKSSRELVSDNSKHVLGVAMALRSAGPEGRQMASELLSGQLIKQMVPGEHGHALPSRIGLPADCFALLFCK